MALVENEQSADRRRARRGGGGVIQTTPTGPRGGGGGGSNDGGGGSNTSSQNPSGSGSSGSGGGGGSSESDYRRKAGNRYLRQSRNLEAQAKAIQYALRHSFGDALRAKLQDVNEMLRQQDKTLMQGYRERYRSLEGALEDNEKAAGTQTQMNRGNTIRERSNVLSEIAAQGAGESDALSAQMMSLRNWQANQAEIDRSQADTLRSINSGLTDLNVDTKSARVNLVAQAQADKSQLWTNYYNQRSESLTQLGNIRGQQADYLEYAKEYGVGKGGGGAVKQASNAFMRSAKNSGKSWDAPGIPKRLRKWDGRDEFESAPRPSSQAQLNAAPTVDLGKRPEGSTLRKWNG